MLEEHAGLVYEQVCYPYFSSLVAARARHTCALPLHTCCHPSNMIYDTEMYVNGNVYTQTLSNLVLLLLLQLVNDDGQPGVELL